MFRDRNLPRLQSKTGNELADISCWNGIVLRTRSSREKTIWRQSREWLKPSDVAEDYNVQSRRLSKISDFDIQKIPKDLSGYRVVGIYGDVIGVGFSGGVEPEVIRSHTKVSPQLSFSGIFPAADEIDCCKEQGESAEREQNSESRNKGSANSIQKFFVGYYPRLKSKVFAVWWLSIVFGGGIGILVAASGHLFVGSCILVIWAVVIGYSLLGT